MVMSLKKSTGFILGCFALSLINIVYIWRLPVLPFTDLANHLFEAYILQGHLRSEYEITTIACYPSSIYAIFCAMFHNVETGNKVFYSIYLLLLPLSTLALIDASRGNKWFAFLSFCFLYSYSVMWGFSGFTIGIALSLLTVYAYICMLTAPSLMCFLLLSCLLIMTFFSHAILFLFVCAVLGCCTLFLMKIPLKSRIIAVSSLFPAGVFFALWTLHSNTSRAFGPTFSFLGPYYLESYLPSLQWRAIHLLMGDNAALANGDRGKSIALLWSVPLLLILPYVLQWTFDNILSFIYPVDRPARSYPDESSAEREPYSAAAIARDAGSVFFIVAAGCFVLLPSLIPGWTYIFERFSVLVFLSLIWMGSFVLPPYCFLSRRLPLRSLVVIMVSVSTILWGHYFWKFEPCASAFRRILQNKPELRGKSLTEITCNVAYRGWPSFPHFQNYHAIWNDGIVPSCAAQYKFKFITRRKDSQVPNYTEWVFEGTTDIASLISQYKTMDFLLVLGSYAVSAVENYGGYTVCDRQNGWVLFRRIDAPINDGNETGIIKAM